MLIRRKELNFRGRILRDSLQGFENEEVFQRPKEVLAEIKRHFTTPAQAGA
jgi:hypothetical protein